MQSTWVEFLQDRLMLRNVIMTVILVLTVLGLRYVALRFIRRRLPSRETRVPTSSTMSVDPSPHATVATV